MHCQVSAVCTCQMRMPQTPLSTTHYTRRCELYRARARFPAARGHARRGRAEQAVPCLPKRPKRMYRLAGAPLAEWSSAKAKVSFPRHAVSESRSCAMPQERPGGNFMEKGDVAWAGGSAGPDFFIMMNRNGFGASHTVWGSMADDESMQLALKLVQRKSSSPRGEMRILDEPVRFTMAPGPASS